MIYPKIYDRLLKRTQSVQDAFPRRAWERARFIGHMPNLFLKETLLQSFEITQLFERYLAENENRYLLLFQVNKKYQHL